MSSRFLPWFALGVSALLAVYIGSYIAYRGHHSHPWQDRTVVVFGRNGWKLALYRPLERLDHILTGATIAIFPEM